MPVRDDWASAAELARQLDGGLTPARICGPVDILFIDDASRQACPPASFAGPFQTIIQIQSLRLRRNLGHQRAIAVGLGYLRTLDSYDAVIVMDADGEDTPEGVLALIREYLRSGGTHAIFAERARRTESFIFRLFYQVYKMLHRVLTGQGVRVGNFSILPFENLSALGVVGEVWNHYAAAVFRSRLPYEMIPIPRGKRIAGESRMNFVALVVHGLSAISVFADVVGVRILIASLLGSLLALLGILVVIGVRLFTSQAIPGWASYLVVGLAILAMQSIMVASSFVFYLLSNRTNLSFIPARDYILFVRNVSSIYPAA